MDKKTEEELFRLLQDVVLDLKELKATLKNLDARVKDLEPSEENRPSKKRK